MSTTTEKMPLIYARRIAEAIKAELAPGCDRIEIAGSIRREKPQVNDVEIVAIPAPACDLFGAVIGTQLNPILDRLCTEGRLEKIKGGDKYKQFRIVKAGVKLDLFLPDVETWGCVFTIRTGSAEFSHRLVTKRQYGGLCPNDMDFRSGRIVRGLKLLATREEADVFRDLGIEWVEPRERTGDCRVREAGAR
jgi:DNA polymerase/3'-5' exonuclease PolX